MIEERVQQTGGGSIRLAGLPADIAAKLVVPYGWMSQVFVSPVRLPVSVLPATADLPGMPGGYITSHRSDSDGLELGLSGWAEILSSQQNDRNFGYPFILGFQSLNLAGWINHMTGGLIVQVGTTTAGSGAPATYMVTGGADTTLKALDTLSAAFNCSWRLRGGLPPIVDMAPHNTLAGYSTPTQIVSPDVPAGRWGQYQALSGRVRVEGDSGDFVTQVIALAGAWDDTSPLPTDAQSVARTAADGPWKHPYGASYGRSRRLDAGSVKLNNPADAPGGDTQTVADLTRLADAELARAGVIPVVFAVDGMDPADVWRCKLHGQVYVQDISAGAAGWGTVMVGPHPTLPLAQMVVGRSLPLLEGCGVYVRSCHQDTLGQWWDLSDWVVPETGGGIAVAPVPPVGSMRTDLLGRRM